jgi:cell division protein FtsI/penicillin-binding protein 2
MRDSIEHTARIRLISVAIIGVAVLLLARAYYVQIVEGDIFTSKADHQYTSPSQEIFDRGTIFFSTKSGILASAATLQSGYTAAIDPKLITDPEGLFRAIGRKLSLERDAFLLKANKKTDPYEEVAKH